MHIKAMLFHLAIMTIGYISWILACKDLLPNNHMPLGISGIIIISLLGLIAMNLYIISSKKDK